MFLGLLDVVKALVKQEIEIELKRSFKLDELQHRIGHRMNRYPQDCKERINVPCRKKSI
jgi:hypothetical protein